MGRLARRPLLVVLVPLATGALVAPACTVCEEKTDPLGHVVEECQTDWLHPARIELAYPPTAVVELVQRDPSQPAPDVLYPGGTLELDGSKSTGRIERYTWALTTSSGAPAEALSVACTETADHHLVCPLPVADSTDDVSPVGAYVAALTVARADGRAPSTARVAFRIAADSRAPEGVAGVRADFTVCAIGDGPRRCCVDDARATPTIRQGEEVVFESTSTPDGALTFRWSVTETDDEGFAVTRALGTSAYGFYVVPETSTSTIVVPWTLQVTERTTGDRHTAVEVCTFAPAAGDVPPPPPPPPPAEPSFFVTARETTGAMGGLTGADALCQAAAESSTQLPAASKQRTWRAYVSDTPTWQGTPPAPVGDWVHARDRIGRGPWLDLAGRVVAQDPSALVASGVAAASMIDEEGRSLSGAAHVWTATLPSGLAETDQDNDFLRFGFVRGACVGWTSDNMFAHAGAGRWDGSSSWVSAEQLGCSARAHLYCFAE
ncbi:hypothetical protein L6R52_21425 [Myxococcota bacterium]|nr:hypothetical protein [Myxococcota bacterium]